MDQMVLSRKLVGMLMPLIGTPAVRENRGLHQCYLTSIELHKGLEEEQQVGLFELMLRFFYDSGVPKKYHNLVFLDAKDGLLERALEGKRFLQTRLGTTLYEVHIGRPEHIPALPQGGNPAFEMAVL